MRTSLPPHFVPGHVFRTGELARLTSNPTRLVTKWVGKGLCSRLRNGLYAVKKTGTFGAVPPSTLELIKAFLAEDPFVLTGPPVWNALGLGATQMFAHELVYNRKRSGAFKLGSVIHHFRRVRFPDDPCLEWFVVDLLENLTSVCLTAEEVEGHLADRLKEGRFDRDALGRMAAEYGSRSTQALVRRALLEASH